MLAGFARVAWWSNLRLSRARRAPFCLYDRMSQATRGGKATPPLRRAQLVCRPVAQPPRVASVGLQLGSKGSEVRLSVWWA